MCVDKNAPITPVLSATDQVMNWFKWLKRYVVSKIRPKLFNLSLGKAFSIHYSAVLL